MTPVELDDIPSADETPQPLLIFEHLFRPPAAVAPSTTSSHPSSTDAPPPATLPPAVEPSGLQDQVEPPKDEQGPRFKDQVLPGLVEPDTAEAIEEGKEEEEEDLQEEHVGIPIASALLVTDTRIELEDRVQQLDLERQHRQHLEVLLQSKKRWIRGIFVAAVGLAAGVAAFLSICGTSGNCRRSDTAGTSPTPTQSRSVSGKRSITAFINNITLSNQTLHYPSNATAEERALLWLIDVDLSTTESNTSSLRQRFALATIWFQTPTGFGDAITAATWTSEITECAWQRVDCDDTGRLVTYLSLSGDGVEGRIPADLGLLTHLTSLSLGGNELIGTIPSSLSSLTALTYLSLWDNALTGTIPSSIASLTALTDLWLYNNELSGTIPFCNSVPNQSFNRLVADCDKVSCPCCTHCCPTSRNGIPVFVDVFGSICV